MDFKRDPRAVALVLAITAMCTVTGATQGGQVTTRPASGGPRTEVTIYAQCATSTSTATVIAYSDAFSPGTVRLRANPGSYWYGNAVVSSNAAAGARPVTVRCGADETLTGAFTVTRSHPTLGPNTGGGWLAMTHQPSSPWLPLVGAATLAALAGMGLAIVRRRRRAERTGVVR